ncbi:MAG: RecX family transcriptional regulator [Planctomycetota bacterium]
MPTITAISPQKRRKNRSNIYLDGKFAFGLSDSVVAARGLGIGTELTDELRADIEQGELRAEAFEAGTRLLSMRLQGESELRTKLKRRDFPPAVIDAVVEELRRLGYLNDAAFAEAKARDAAKARGHGSRRALAELRKVGVDEKTAAAAVEKVYEEHDDVAVARDLAAKKLRTLTRFDDATKKRRLYGMLARRGFDSEICATVIDEVLSGAS